MEASTISRRTVSWCREILCARNAVKYNPAASNTVVKANTPAAENTPSLRTRQLGLGLDHFLKCPDSTLSPINNKISPTAKETLINTTQMSVCEFELMS